ncbi:MAG: CRISPR-associated endonuclease Cas2 [Lachnospirales bacterium]
MIIISYDISNDKLRTRFNKYIKKYGFRMQYSVYQIDNSERVLNNIVVDITNKFEKQFSQEDSVIIFNMSKNCKITRFGYAKNEESDLIIIK